MCGFFGVFGSRMHGTAQTVGRTVAASLAHRGPDDYQVFERDLYEVMFWRLSIVDQLGGKQPMVSADGKTVVLFNGEVYNYKALRRELEVQGYAFRTASDTEVIVAAYQVWGHACFRRFEGMFAVCIIDEAAGRIVLGRDRLGVKPLYFESDGAGLRVASEQKALVAWSQTSPQLDRESALRYLVFQTIPGVRTLFRGVSKVPPGHVVEFDLKTFILLGVHRIPSVRTTPRPASYAEYAEAVRRTVSEHVRLALDTDHRWCLHLSGGLDSNLLLALARDLSPDREIVCVSSVVGGDADPEWPFIRESAERQRARLRVVTIDPASFFEALDDVIFYLDEPVGDPGVVAQFLVNRVAAEESKIVYSGQGADEMFFGYVRNLAAYVLASGDVAIHPNTTEFLRGWEPFLQSMTENRGRSVEFAYFKKLCRFDPFVPSDDASPEFLEAVRAIALETFLELLEPSSSLNDFMLRAETRIQLPALLHMEDRASMRYSLETRVPLCTTSVLDLAAAGELDWKFRDGCPKGVLRDAFRDVIPEHILRRKQKIGRPIPLRAWLEEAPGAAYVASLKNKRELFWDLTGMDFVQYALMRSNQYDRSAWAALSLAKWIDLYGVAV
jgi:asparagine synthase (glutamine-hydrolysing)